MDGRQFDHFARRLATSTSRRRVLRALAGVAGGLAGIAAGASAGAAARRDARRSVVVPVLTNKGPVATISGATTWFDGPELTVGGSGQRNLGTFLVGGNPLSATDPLPPDGVACAPATQLPVGTTFDAFAVRFTSGIACFYGGFAEATIVPGSVFAFDAPFGLDGTVFVSFPAPEDAPC